jgi:acyl-CoA thioesterase I
VHHRRIVFAMNRLILSLSVFCLLLQFSCKESNPVEVPYPPLPAMTLPWTTENSIVCFGTSLTYGYGAGAKNPFCKQSGPTFGRTSYIHFTTGEILRLTALHEQHVAALYKRAGGCFSCTGDSSYPRFLQEALKIRVYNQGYTAARINTALDVLQDSVLSKKPVLVLLEFGANEFLQNVDPHVADSLLGIVIQELLAGGTKVVLLSFINPDMGKYMATGTWNAQDSVDALAYYTMLKNVAAKYSLPFIDYPLLGIFGHPELMSDQLHPNGEGYRRMAENVFFALIDTFSRNGMLR